jgi:hypothetical protein
MRMGSATTRRMSTGPARARTASTTHPRGVALGITKRVTAAYRAGTANQLGGASRTGHGSPKVNHGGPGSPRIPESPGLSGLARMFVWG